MAFYEIEEMYGYKVSKNDRMIINCIHIFIIIFIFIILFLLLIFKNDL